MLIIGSLLWTAVIVLIVYNWRKAGDRNALVLRNVWRNGRIFVAVVPVALIAAGFLAPLIPAELVGRWLGESAGFGGILIGALAGFCIPVPPVIFFPIVAVLLKSGAGVAQMTALVAAWNVFAFHRTLPIELPVMGGYFVSLRLMSSLFIPPAAGLAAMFISGGL